MYLTSRTYNSYWATRYSPFWAKILLYQQTTCCFLRSGQKRFRSDTFEAWRKLAKLLPVFGGSFVQSYCEPQWHSQDHGERPLLRKIANYGMHVILGKPPHTSSSSLRDQLGWTTLHERRQRFMLTQVHKCLLNLALPYLTNKFKLNSTMYTGTRGSGNIYLYRYRVH